jgi:hypothetical protein
MAEEAFTYEEQASAKVAKPGAQQAAPATAGAPGGTFKI